MYPNSEAIENIVLNAKPTLARIKGSLEFLEKFDLQEATLNDIEQLRETARELEHLACNLDDNSESIHAVANKAELYFEEHQTDLEESKLAQALADQRGHEGAI